MIRLTCANCQAQLEVDDAFAGGVCRCKHCGAIQTVPKPGRPSTVGSAAGGAGEGPRTLYQAKNRTGLSSTPSGLEELAEVVHGSGLGSGLRNNRPTPRTPVAPPATVKSRTGLWIGLSVGIVAATLAVVLVLMNRPTTGNSASGGGGGATASNGAAAPVAATPAFAGVDLAGSKVVYVLDRGDATQEFFPALKALTVQSVRSLGPDRLFQVVLWDNGQPDAYPGLSAKYATDEEVANLSRWFDQVPTGRPTDALPAVKQAMASTPDTIVLATGKSLQLDEKFADDVLAARGGRTIIHAFTLGETSPDDPLRKVAQASGGKFVNLTHADLPKTD